MAMGVLHKFFICAVAVCCLPGASAQADTAAIGTLTAVNEHFNGLNTIAVLPFTNPAVNVWWASSSLTSLGVDFFRRMDGGDADAVDARKGSAETLWSGGAETYTKFRNTTLWGHGRYVNGRTSDVRWNESADADLIYPYILADSVGGDIKREQYSFGGGYAAVTDRWAWGVSISYEALLECRDVDPRPKNVSGRLDMAVGGAFRFMRNHYGGVSFRLCKYKQTNDIEFISEMGVDKIFHLTGLATHYQRFAGTGMSTYYNGMRYGVGIDVFPFDSRGAYLSCLLERFSFENILSDFNKLPMASAWHNSLSVEGGWLAPASRGLFWGVNAALEVYRRHGTENIFGDATSNVYPQIAANTLFADNAVTAKARVLWGVAFSEVSSLSTEVHASWHRRTLAHIDPYRYSLTQNASAGVVLKACLPMPGKWQMSARAGFDMLMPFGCDMLMTPSFFDAELRQLVDIERRTFSLDSHRSYVAQAAVFAHVPVKGRFLARFGLQWQHRDFSHPAVHADSFTASIAAVF